MSEWKETEYGTIPSNWSFINATIFCEKVTDGTHDSPKQQLVGKHLVTSKHIKGRNIDFENAYLISEEDYIKINERSRVNQWDVIISMIGEYCGFVYVERNKKIDYAVKNVGLFKTGNKYKAFWLFYYIQSKIGNSYLDSHKSGTSQPYITLGTLREFPILMPEFIEEQKAIISVLSSIDDKIDLLHRQNATLEAMAETLFRQWFVEEAKEDWEVKIITTFFEVRDGTHDSPKQKTFGKPLITSKHISNNKIDIESAYLISEEDFENVNKRSKVDSNDILFSMIGTIGLIYFEQSDSVNYAIKNIGLFKTSQNPIWRFYTYLWLKSQLGQDFIHEHRSGSTQEYISLGSLRSISFDEPPKILLEKFNVIVATYFGKIKNNMNQIRTLITLRDTLLPKLMSGEVRVKM